MSSFDRTPERPYPEGLFPLGRAVATPPALDFLRKHKVDPLALLARHHKGDWGEGVDKGDWKANNNAVLDGERILSAYKVADEQVWIITEANRSVTTILMPNDY